MKFLNDTFLVWRGGGGSVLRPRDGPVDGVFVGHGRGGGGGDGAVGGGVGLGILLVLAL